jgi:rsbT antagonist protein RsbS
MEQIPILRIQDILLVSIQSELYDRQAERLQKDILQTLTVTHARGVLVDVTALQVIDSFLGRMIGETASMTRLMGAKTVLVGLQPAVAITLVELGLHLDGVHTALNMEQGLAWLNITISGR